LARLQEKMRDAELGVVLIYTSFARPSAVAWLTHFVPYWNEALLVVLPTGAPVLLAAFSKRVHDWIRSVSHLGEVRSAPDLGRAAVNFLEERLPKPSRIGVLVYSTGRLVPSFLQNTSLVTPPGKSSIPFFERQ